MYIQYSVQYLVQYTVQYNTQYITIHSKVVKSFYLSASLHDRGQHNGIEVLVGGPVTCGQHLHAELHLTQTCDRSSVVVWSSI